ncbi:MAG: Hpt domain-containing protein [Aquabacterium sp.]
MLDEEGEPTTVPMGLREMAFVPTPDDATQATHAAPETPDDVSAPRTRPRSAPPTSTPSRPARRGAVPRTRAADDAGNDIFDAEVLRRLKELDPRGDNRLLERVAKLLKTRRTVFLPQMDEAFKMNDNAAIMHVAHTLKSSSASIGALKLSHMCA